MITTLETINSLLATADFILFLFIAGWLSGGNHEN